MLSETANGKWVGSVRKGIAILLFTAVCLFRVQHAAGQHSSAQPKAQPCGAFIGTPKIKLPEKIKTEKLNRFPVINYRFGEDGKPFDVRVEKTTGSTELDDLLVRQVKEWRLASHPGCGVILASMKIVIDVR